MKMNLPPLPQSGFWRTLFLATAIAGSVALGGCQSLRDVAQRARATPADAAAAEQKADAAAPANHSAQAPAPTTPPVSVPAVAPAVAAAAAPVSKPAPATGAPLAATTAAAPVDNSHSYPGTGIMVKPGAPAPVAPPVPGEETYNLNFEQADIRAIAQSIMGDYLHESFSIHPQTAGTATIRMSRPVPKRELIPILEMLLRQNGQVMVKEDGMFKILPQALGTRGTLTPQVAGSGTLPNGYTNVFVQLKYVGAKDMQRILEPYAIEPAISIRIDEPRNLLSLSGTQLEVKHMLEVVDLFDVDFLSGYSIGLFPMQTDVKSLSADLDRLFGNAAAGTSPLAGIVRIIPIERMNGLLVVTTQAKYLEEAKKWIDRLDRSGGLAGGMRLNVYAVQNSKAEKLAQLLSDVYGNRTGGTSPTLAPGQRPATIGSPTTPTTTPGGTPTPTAPVNPLAALASLAFQGSGIGVSKDTRIIADTDNNALLILASPSDYETILAALRQLDVPRRQVSVEVMVAEVTLKDDLSFGIDWFLRTRNSTVGSLRNPNGSTPYVPTLPSSPTPVFPTGTNDIRSVIPQVGSGLQLINTNPLTGDIRAVLETLGSDGRVTVLSAPRVMVLDNEKATINVGQQISVSTGSTTVTAGAGTVTSNQYINTGVILTVTPRINSGGKVTLDLSQEVSAAGIPDVVGANPPINTRKAQTVVTVASGETMALAGMIGKNQSTTSSGLPLVSKIPVIGALFGKQTFHNDRTELVVLITPVVINNTDEARQTTDEIRRKLPTLEQYFPKRKEAEPVPAKQEPVSAK